MAFSDRSGLLKILISAVFVFFLIPPFFYYAPQPGLDSSWNIALHLAYKYHLQFGRDFVFTYGPLGILNSRLPVSMSVWVYLLFDLYLFVIHFVVLFQVFRRHFSGFTVLFIFLNVLLTQYAPAYQWYFYYFYFFLLGYLNNPSRNAWLFHAMLLSVLSFYFKISYGFITMVVLAVVLGYLFLSGKKNWKWFFATLLVYAAGIRIAAQILNVNIAGYFRGSLSFIDGYNDAMYRQIDGNSRPYLHLAIISFALFVGCILFLAAKSPRRKNWFKNQEYLLSCLLVAGGFYIIFKSSFVRSDGGMLFFQYISLFAALLYLNAGNEPARKLSRICSCALLVIACFAINLMPDHFHPVKRLTDLTLISNKIAEAKNYFTQIPAFTAEEKRYEHQGAAGNEYKSIVGEKTADVIPAEISTIFFNGLHYAPAPVIQQYAAYNTYLDGLNFAKYRSATAPDYIFYSISGIDDRYAFADGARAKLALFNRYRINGSVHDDLVLKRHPGLNALETTGTFDSLRCKLDQNIPLLRSDDILYSRILVRYNLLGSLKRFLFQPPVLRIVITLDNGTEHSFRAIVPMLADGMILNKYIDSQEEFQEYLQSAALNGANIVSVRLHAEEAGFKPDITLINTWYRFAPKTAADRQADSAAIVILRQKYRPVLVNPARYLPDTVRNNVEVVNDYSSIISMRGWAFRDSADNGRNQVTGLLVKNADTAYLMPSGALPRPDLKSAFQRNDLGMAGFRAEVDRESLPMGVYRFALGYTDSITGKKWIKYTDRTVVLKAPVIPDKTDLAGSRKVERTAVDMDLGTLNQNYYNISLDGWAQIKGLDTTGLRTRIVLQGTAGSFAVDAQVKQRPDVAGHFHDPHYLSSGFSARIPSGTLPAGKYTVLIEKTAADGTRYLIETGSQLAIDPVPDPVSHRWIPAG